MAVAVRFELRGVQECLQKLSGLKNSVQRRILRKAVRAACVVGARGGKRYVPRETGLLRKSLKYKVAKAKPGVFRALGIVGPESKKVNGRNAAKYAHLLEGGTKPHMIQGNPLLAFDVKRRRRWNKIVATKVNHPGTKPTRFMQKIQVTGQHSMSMAFRGKMNAELLKEAAKARPSEVDDGQ